MSERRSNFKTAATVAEDLSDSLPGREVAQLTARWIENWGQINGHIVSITQSSLRNSVNAVDELRQCQSPGDVLDVQFKLVRQTCDDYLDEARQLSELVVKLSSEAISAAGKTAVAPH